MMVPFRCCIAVTVEMLPVNGAVVTPLRGQLQNRRVLGRCIGSALL